VAHLAWSHGSGTLRPLPGVEPMPATPVSVYVWIRCRAPLSDAVWRGKLSWGVAVLALAAACGGHLGGGDVDGGSRNDAIAPVGASSSLGATSGASPGETPGSGSSSSGTVQPSSGPSTGPGTAVPEDAGCTQGVLPTEPPDAAFSPCWTCVSRGCQAQLAQCASDCACNEDLARALACVNNGGQPLMCFGAGQSPGLNAIDSCLLMAGGDCGCSTSSPGLTLPPKPGTNCVPSVNDNGESNGQCESDLVSDCNGTHYQVICTCPRGQCACFGPTTKIIPFGGCPYCPSLGPGPQAPGGPSISDLFAACGYPH
jgi:hypothetical protein